MHYIPLVKSLDLWYNGVATIIIQRKNNPVLQEAKKCDHIRNLGFLKFGLMIVAIRIWSHFLLATVNNGRYDERSQSKHQFKARWHKISI